MAELVLHIGMGKAASTTIQRNLLGNPAAPPSIGRHNAKVDEARGLPAMWWRGLMTPSIERAGQAKEILEREYIDSNNLVVLSDEIIGASPVLVENLLANLIRLDLKVKFLLVTRVQADFLQSLYNHSTRSRVNALGLPPMHRELSNRLFYKGEINQWVDDLFVAQAAGDRNILECLAYDRLVDRLRSVSGDDGVVVLPMELLKGDRELFVESLAKVFAMEPEIITTGLEKRQNVTGNRLRDYHLGASAEKLMKNDLFKPLKRTGLTRKAVTDFLLPVFSMTKLKNQSLLDEDVKTKITEFFCAHNEALDEMLPYDLRGLGYY